LVLQEEISAHLDSRSFGKVLTDLKAQHRRRAVILNNNQVETVIVPVDDYEKMAEALDLLEHMEIHRLVTQRARKKGKNTVTLESLLKEQRRAIDPQRLSDHQPRAPGRSRCHWKARRSRVLSESTQTVHPPGPREGLFLTA